MHDIEFSEDQRMIRDMARQFALASGQIIGCFCLSEPQAGSEAHGNRWFQGGVDGAQAGYSGLGHLRHYPGQLRSSGGQSAGCRGARVCPSPCRTWKANVSVSLLKAVGIARSAFEATLAYARERTQFGVPLTEHRQYAHGHAYLT